MFRRQQGACFLGRAHGRTIGGVGGVRLWRGRDVEDRLGDCQFTFGRAEEIIRILCGVADYERLRVGKADILDRHAHHSPRDIERVLAGIEHAAKIIERRIRVRAAHRFMQGTDQIVVAVLLFVVDRGAPLHHLLQFRSIKDLASARRAPNLLGKRECRAAVAVGHADQRLAGLGVERKLSPFDRFRAGKQVLERRRIERLEHQHARAREERRDQLEGRILGRGANEDDRAVFHDRQEGILLRAIEAMNFIDEEKGSLPYFAPLARRVKDLFEVRNT